MGGFDRGQYTDEGADVSRSVKLCGFGDSEITERLKSKASEDVMDVVWMAIADPMVTPARILDPVMHHIEHEGGVDDSA